MTPADGDFRRPANRTATRPGRAAAALGAVGRTRRAVARRVRGEAFCAGRDREGGDAMGYCVSPRLSAQRAEVAALPQVVGHEPDARNLERLVQADPEHGGLSRLDFADDASPADELLHAAEDADARPMRASSRLLMVRIGIATEIVVVGDLVGRARRKNRPSSATPPIWRRGCRAWPSQAAS